MAENKYIRFDWAVKRMLRDKANFDVLEGLVTVLLGDEIHITEILESEGNQEMEDDKFNRVDIKAKNSKGEIIIVEVQLSREVHYLQRILYGVSKTITEHIKLGEDYGNVKKVYSISILYFDLGKGSDYLYHGQTTFQGVHTHDTLQITSRERDVIEMATPEKIFPEYFLIRVNEFNKVAVTPIEEWLDYLRSGHIKDDTTVPGLQQAREKLQYIQMSEAERHAYERHVDNMLYESGAILAAKRDGIYEGRAEGLAKGLEKGLAKGREEGRAEGLAKGRAEEKAEIVKNMYDKGYSPEIISDCTRMSREDVDEIIKSLK